MDPAAARPNIGCMINDTTHPRVISMVAHRAMNLFTEVYCCCSQSVHVYDYLGATCVEMSIGKQRGWVGKYKHDKRSNWVI